MIDKWDIQKFKWFLFLARRYGTGRITVVAGDELNTWVVRVED